MNEFKPALGIEFDDKYKQAQNKLIEFATAWYAMTPAQQEFFIKEFMSAAGVGTVFEQFIRYMNENGGNR